MEWHCDIELGQIVSVMRSCNVDHLEPSTLKLNIANCTLQIEHCTLPPEHCTVHTAHCCTLHATHNLLYTTHGGSDRSEGGLLGQGYCIRQSGRRGRREIHKYQISKCTSNPAGRRNKSTRNSFFVWFPLLGTIYSSLLFIKNKHMLIQVLAHCLTFSMARGGGGFY